MKVGIRVRRSDRQGIYVPLLQLLGLESVEQRLLDARLSFGHRAQRMRVRAYRVLPIAVVSAGLVLYAAGVVTLAVRKLRAGKAPAGAVPAEGETSTEGTEAEQTEAEQTEAVEIAV